MAKNSKIAVVLPCYKSSAQVIGVLKRIPAAVAKIYCVDDACPEQTGEHIKNSTDDKRVVVLNHAENQGVGGAVMTGYAQALKDGMDIVVKIDSDGQMDPHLLPGIVRPLINGQADYTKGNRFYTPEFLEGMPMVRLIGNAGLSFLNKFSSGYWQVMDPTNGYTAIHASVLRLLPLNKINKGYFFESDMLFRLGTLRAVVMDVPQKAIYGDEQSSLRITNAFWTFALYHVRNFYKRIVYNYFVRDFNVASLEWIIGPLLFIFSLVFGISSWMEAVQNQTSASAGTVMLAALPFLAGLQLILSALHFDVQNQPKTPIQTLMDDGET